MPQDAKKCIFPPHTYNLLVSQKLLQRVFFHLSPVILANATVVVFVLLCSVNFHCYTYSEGMPTQSSAPKWQLDPFATSCVKDHEEYSLMQTSFTSLPNSFIIYANFFILFCFLIAHFTVLRILILLTLLQRQVFVSECPLSYIYIMINNSLLFVKKKKVSTEMNINLSVYMYRICYICCSEISEVGREKKHLLLGVLGVCVFFFSKILIRDMFTIA